MIFFAFRLKFKQTIVNTCYSFNYCYHLLFSIYEKLAFF